jgi:predicted transposase/invertase (TIGR01784 family)
MAIGISPLVDHAFKRLLGNEKHTRITIHFLNAVLTGQPRINQVQILNPIHDRQTFDDKLSILDILAIDELGRLLNIEVQTWLPYGMAQRLAYYASRSYVNQLRKGQDYSELRPSISICVLAEPLFTTPPTLHLDFRLREKASIQTLTDDLQIHLLQLSHLQLSLESIYDVSERERWACFLRDADKLTTAEIKRLFPAEEFAEAAGILDMIAQTPEELMEYNARLKFQRDESARLQRARIEGRQEGREEGEVRGRVTLLQQLLGEPVWTPEEFASRNADELTVITDQLLQRLRERGI